MGLHDFFVPPHDATAAQRKRWEFTVGYGLTGAYLMQFAFMSLCFGLVMWLHPGFATASSVSQMASKLEHSLEKQNTQIAVNSLTLLQIQLDGWTSDQCIAESMNNRGLANAIAARIREKQPAYRKLSGGEAYDPLPCP